ncbi:CLUMA_CG016142, isoform A [Clunio marinus]|uniref:CLUMA_CG016142, isoform A n=1 Tax=Clunio marinus TaxID=568069 RepID=A0A1J1ITB3_9DIPT|nr:CLUMA_CG016142, isoform A [Clunio marinus]
MKLFIIILVFVGCTYGQGSGGKTVEEQWNDFKDLFQRSFDKVEDKMRFQIYKHNLALVEAQNAKFARGESDHGAAINDLSDRTPEEKQVLEQQIRPVPA